VRGQKIKSGTKIGLRSQGIPVAEREWRLAAMREALWRRELRGQPAPWLTTGIFKAIEDSVILFALPKANLGATDKASAGDPRRSAVAGV
jgi:hypothetical protein